MNPDQFYRARHESWLALTGLLDLAQKSRYRLTPRQIEELGRLYRIAGADLATAQRDFPESELTRYLNQLVGRAHAVIYRERPVVFGRIQQFVVGHFPGAFRAHGVFIGMAALIFILPALIAGLLVRFQPETAYWLLPPEVRALEETLQEKQLWTEIPIEERPYASSFIMRNNIQVSFLAFGVGVLGGVFTLWVLALNGLLLGGATGLTATYGLGLDLWTFVIGHGVIELSVIMMAGGAGLSLGWAVLRPGLLRRRDALTLAARRALPLIAGAVPLLVIAGLIEGFISPADHIPAIVKWFVGIGSGILLYAYLLLAGRGNTSG